VCGTKAPELRVSLPAGGLEPWAVDGLAVGEVARRRLAAVVLKRRERRRPAVVADEQQRRRVVLARPEEAVAVGGRVVGVPAERSTLGRKEMGWSEPGTVLTTTKMLLTTSRREVPQPEKWLKDASSWLSLAKQVLWKKFRGPSGGRA
jgi:hypothetical protein